MCCGKCGVWQHIACHDSVDKRAGRPLRNWESVEFTCQKCHLRQFAPTNGSSHTAITHIDSAQRRPLSESPAYGIPAHLPHPSLYCELFILLLIFVINFSYQAHRSSIQLDRSLDVMGGPSKHDSNQPARFTYYQPSERSYAQYPAYVKHTINSQSGVPQNTLSHPGVPPDHRTTMTTHQPVLNTAHPSEMPQRIGFTAPYIPYTYPKASGSYTSTYTSGSQQQPYIPQHQSGPPVSGQASYHPQV